jgi:hypothetical protein
LVEQPKLLSLVARKAAVIDQAQVARVDSTNSMLKSFVLELPGEWSEFADECISLKALFQSLPGIGIPNIGRNIGRDIAGDQHSRLFKLRTLLDLVELDQVATGVGEDRDPHRSVRAA